MIKKNYFWCLLTSGVDFREKTLDIDGEIFKVSDSTINIHNKEREREKQRSLLDFHLNIFSSFKFGTRQVKVGVLRREGMPLMNMHDTFVLLERFRRSMISHYYRNVHAVIYVYDVTNLSSFENLPAWINECDKHVLDAELPRILVGNKCDIAGEQVVSTAVAQRFAVRYCH